MKTWLEVKIDGKWSKVDMDFTWFEKDAEQMAASERANGKEARVVRE
ncbi:MAG: hypothetical protein NT069_21095 [Planctomycetota bacterium]|nr:hypothetical protein [Planctomycetota bacterium]